MSRALDSFLARKGNQASVPPQVLELSQANNKWIGEFWFQHRSDTTKDLDYWNTLCELHKTLGPERLQFYCKHHRLAALCEKLQVLTVEHGNNQQAALTELQKLDTFSLENDRILPHLLKADYQQERWTSPKAIAIYDLDDYNPDHHPYTCPEDENFNPGQTREQKEAFVQEFLRDVFHNVMMPLAEQRANLYQQLQVIVHPIHVQIKQYKEKLQNLGGTNGRNMWLYSNEQKYLEAQIQQLNEQLQSKPVHLLEAKIDIFSSIIDRMCYDLRAVEKRQATLIDFFRATADVLRNQTRATQPYDLFDWHTPENVWVTNAYRVEKLRSAPLAAEELTTPTQRFSVSYKSIREISSRPTTFRQNIIPQDNLSVPHLGSSTQSSKKDSCQLFTRSTGVLLEAQNYVKDFLRGLAGIVLVPLRGLLGKCAPECLQKTAFYRTKSRYCIFQAEEKLFSLAKKLQNEYGSDWYCSIDVTVKTSEDGKKYDYRKCGLGSTL